MILWGRAQEHQRIIRCMTYRLRWQSCGMQITYMLSELNPADPISRWWQGYSAKDMVMLARARHQCFERTVRSPRWGGCW